MKIISLDKATAAIRKAFENGDAVLVGQLHSPNVIKYFGGNNVIVGRDAVEKGARDWFQSSKVEFIKNTVENTVFVGNIAIQTLIFQLRRHRKMEGNLRSAGAVPWSFIFRIKPVRPDGYHCGKLHRRHHVNKNPHYEYELDYTNYYNV